MDKMNYGSMKFVSNGVDDAVTKAGIEVANEIGYESYNASVEDIVARALYDYNFKGGDYDKRGHRVPSSMPTKDFAELCDKALYEFYGNVRSDMRKEIDAGWDVNMDEYLEANAENVFLNMKPDVVGAPDAVSKLVADACGKCDSRNMEYAIAPIYAGGVSPASINDIPGSPYKNCTIDDLVNIVNGSLNRIEDALKNDVADGIARVKIGPDLMPAICDIGRYFEANPQAVSKIAGKYANFEAGYFSGPFKDDLIATRNDYINSKPGFRFPTAPSQPVDYPELTRRPDVVLNGAKIDLNAKDYSDNIVDLQAGEGLDYGKLASAPDNFTQRLLDAKQAVPPVYTATMPQNSDYRTIDLKNDEGLANAKLASDTYQESAYDKLQRENDRQQQEEREEQELTAGQLYTEMYSH